MAAKIGILGEGTVHTNGLVTLYTVGSGKAARVRILYANEGGANGNDRYSILIGTPGSEITIHRKTTVSGRDHWTGFDPVSSPNPALSTLTTTQGIMEKSGAFDLDTESFDSDWNISPLPIDYYLNAGDTVRVNIQDGTRTDHLIQVQGVEDDA